LDVLLQDKNYPDVVRESQEVVELSLKGLLKHLRIEVPRVHDVGGILRENLNIVPLELKKSLDQIIAISKDLRRDRELAFYGSEDLLPLEFYSEADAKQAISDATFVVNEVSPVVRAE
jgi:HEPN domain-containing protein